MHLGKFGVTTSLTKSGLRPEKLATWDCSKVCPYTLPAKRLRTNKLIDTLCLQKGWEQTKKAHTLCLQNLLDTAHRPRHKLQSKFTVHTLCMDSNCTHALNFSHTGNHDPNANSDHASPHAQHYICCKNFHLLTCLWQLTLCLQLTTQQLTTQQLTTGLQSGPPFVEDVGSSCSTPHIPFLFSRFHISVTEFCCWSFCTIRLLRSVVSAPGCFCNSPATAPLAWNKKDRSNMSIVIRKANSHNVSTELSLVSMAVKWLRNK